MSKKFFSLIYGDHIHIAPKTKHIPADNFSTLLEAGEVLEHIKQDAEKYRMQVAQECEEIKEKAHKEGYEEGFAKWAEHLVNLEKEIESVHKELQQLVIPVALKAAQKIVGREIELSEDVIVDIVAANLKAVAQHKKITIYVNKKDLEILEKNKPRLRDLFESLESLSIRPRDDVAPGGCVIETEIGIINAQLEHRWRVLEKAFEKLAKNNIEPAKSS
ncbi:HrpE/YscL family type III secretion apparatus protein [Candidatus Protochlamydia phocaeensis]|uniref:HrpE/YscL family type III secretion apparatus protein n=1 Tax=Candidatus Protochlamydia phocaeensis TaxID=1414722 RepID=UPI000838583B|nr:HrpE/YscL family type III secretion apparatus protein [Candidatus Protochlamydia phocaeensis]